MMDEEIREALEAEGYSPEYIAMAIYINKHLPAITDALIDMAKKITQIFCEAFNQWDSMELLADLPTIPDAERLNLAVPWRKKRRHTPKYIRPTKRQQVQRRPARVARSSCQRHHG